MSTATLEHETEQRETAREAAIPEIIKADVTTAVVRYDITDAAITEMQQRYFPLKVAGPTDEDGCKKVHAARMVVKNHRVAVEKRRKELNADALEWQRRVNARAKEITASLEPIESHLDAQEKIVTEEKERQRKAAEEAERLRIEAEEKARKEAEAAEFRRQSEELDRQRRKLEELKAREEAELAERQRVENERLQAERRKLEEEHEKAEAELRERERVENERLQAERDRLAEIERRQREEQERIDAEKRRLELEKAEREAAERARVETEARLKREAEERERREIEEREQAERERLRIETMRPDVEKVRAFAKVLRGIESPAVTSDAANLLLSIVSVKLVELAEKCEEFKAE